ncbi:MAG TPA: hypothetical protein VIC33_13805 [Vicinamibacterales bacterium]|jgi:hypothetical protein
MREAREEYATRLAQHRSAAAAFDRTDRVVATTRLLVAAMVVLVAWWAFGADTISPWWLLVPIGAFVGLVFHHDRVLARRDAGARVIAFHERGLARLADEWAGTGASGERFLDDQHLYARDLDLFGRGSLFELLSAARTAIGERTLASWLLAPARPDEVGRRQACVEELRPFVQLREDLAALGDGTADRIDADHLGRWAGSPPHLTSRGARLVALLLALAAIATAVGWWKLGWGYWPFFITLVIESVFARACREAVERVTAELHDASKDLSRLAGILARLEREPFTTPPVVELQRQLHASGEPASHAIARLGRLVTMLDSKDNEMFMPFASALLWTTQIAFAVEAWRARTGPAVPRWLTVVGEFEALLSLAGYSFEHPDDPFPAVEPEGSRFEGDEIGHPLLPAREVVRNTVRLGGADPQAILVSGSNMSGKSTLLRTVGINAVLALAGAPVRARALTISPLAIGATLRIEDSLQAGRSRFFAEISRLREIVDLTAGPRPVLFLLDEIFHGTNSHDRRIGAEAVIRSLIDRRAIGLVTTHDLALTESTRAAGAAVANMHFEDQFVGETMTFDYRLRPGVVEKSNALALMRAVGLDV